MPFPRCSSPGAPCRGALALTDLAALAGRGPLQTQKVTATLVLYNQIDHLFSYFETVFTFLNAGELVATSRVDTVDMMPYSTPRDSVRAWLEISFVLMWAGFCLGTARDMLAIHRRGRELRAGGPAAASSPGKRLPGSPRSDLPATIGEYCRNELFILFSLALQAVEIIFWLVLAYGYEMGYSVPARVEVYASLTNTVRPLQLAGNSDAGLMRVADLMSELKNISTLNAIYDMMHGLSLIVIVVRLLACAPRRPAAPLCRVLNDWPALQRPHRLS